MLSIIVPASNHLPTVSYIARRLWDRKSGAIAALFVAVSSLHVANSQFAATDVPMAFMVTLSLAFCVRLVRTGHWQDYLFAGLGAGLAVSTKYNAAPVFASLVVAHSLASYPDLVDWRLVVGIGATFVGFAVGTPYAFVEMGTFWSDILFELEHYASGHAGAEDEDTWRWILHVLFTQEGLLLPLGILGGFASAVRRLNREALPLSTFVLLYYGMIARQAVRFNRNLVVLVPPLAVLGAGFVRLVLRRPTWSQRSELVRMGTAAIIAGGLMIPLTKVIKQDLLLSRQDVRTTATDWITSHIPPDSRIAGESYAPSLNPEVYNVEYFGEAIEHGPDWYREQGFDYLMLSSGMYGRFYAQSKRYSQQVAQYDEILRAFEEVTRFAGPMMGYPGGEVRVLKVGENEETD